MIERIKQNILPALIHVGYSILYLLVILPFDMWVKAIERLAAQKENGALSLSKIGGPWPYLTFLKNLFFEFLFDFCILICWAVGLIDAISDLIDGIPAKYFLLDLVMVYYMPIWITLFRDLCQFGLLPLRKLISWLRKPAQYMDLKVEKKDIS